MLVNGEAYCKIRHQEYDNQSSLIACIDDVMNAKIAYVVTFVPYIFQIANIAQSKACILRNKMVYNTNYNYHINR